MRTLDLIIKAAQEYSVDEYEQEMYIRTLDDCFYYFTHEDLLRACYNYILDRYEHKSGTAMIYYRACIEYLYDLYPKVF